MAQVQNQPQPLPQQKNNTTFIRTCFNGLNVLSGIGILSVPYALSQGGWLCLTLLVLIALLCFYTGLLLKRCMETDPHINTYSAIGGRAFGNKGRIIISTFLYLELFLLAVEFLILEGDNLQNLFPNFGLHVFGQKVRGKQAFVLISAVVVLPTTWLRDLTLLAYVSVVGVLTSVVLVFAVFWNGVFGGVEFGEKGVLWRWNGIPTAISLYTFCYCGHSVFPTLYCSMKDKSKFRKVLLVCFGLNTIIYGSMATIGYLMYGQNLNSQVTLNLPTKHVSSKIAIYTIVLTPVTKYALIITPIARAIEDAIISQINRPIMLLIIRTCLVVSTVVVALFVPHFGYVVEFSGAFLGIATTLLFPCLCYLKINKAARQFGGELIFIIVILVFGFFVAITGTFSSLKKIVHSK